MITWNSRFAKRLVMLLNLIAVCKGELKVLHKFKYWAIPVNEDTPLWKTNFAFSPKTIKLLAYYPSDPIM